MIIRILIFLYQCLQMRVIDLGANDGMVHNIMSLMQISAPLYPVVVKMGHAHSGMGKVRMAALVLNNIKNTTLIRLIRVIKQMF